MYKYTASSANNQHRNQQGHNNKDSPSFVLLPLYENNYITLHYTTLQSCRNSHALMKLPEIFLPPVSTLTMSAETLA